MAVLLRHMGEEGRSIFKSFNVDIDKIKSEELIKLYDNHFQKKKNTAMERHVFFTQVQGDKTVQQYITTLRNLSSSCEFGALRDDLIKSIFICGLSTRHNDIKEKLLSSGNIKLAEATEIAVIMESSKNHVENLGSENVFAGKVCMYEPGRSASSRSSNVWGRLGNSYQRSDNHQTGNSTYDRVGKSRNSYMRTGISRSSHYEKNNNGDKCSKCGMIHEYKCPAIGAICRYCKGENHFARMCRKRARLNKVNNSEFSEIDSSEENEDFFIGAVKLKYQKGKPKWMVELKTNGCKLMCQIDTGAEANVMSYSFWI